MSFQAAEWEEDDTGDQLHGEIFSKTKKKVKSKLKKGDKSVTEKSRPNLNISLLSKNITQKLQNILTNDESESSEPEEPVRKKVKTTKSTPKTKAVVKKLPTKLKKKVKRLEKETLPSENSVAKIQKVTGLNIANLKKQLAQSLQDGEKKDEKISLRDKMMDKLSSARFRFLNEQMYTVVGSEAQKLFQEDPEAFQAYHDGYRNQVKKWPVNPIDTIIASIKNMSENKVIGDFGCGDAKLSQNVSQKVHSFDLVASNENIVACEMSKVPLKNNSLDVAVYCLSLMGTNLKDYLFEANRVLKVGGILKIAEVESRFGDEGVETFINGVQKFGFKKTWEDFSHNLFYFIDFVKERNLKQKNKLPTISLKPCLYKKR